MATAYDYIVLTLAPVPTPHQALAAHVRTLAGVDVLGQFAPQLGWVNNEAAVLLRRSEAVSGDVRAIAAPALVTDYRVEPLTATPRPADDDRPSPGGIYVHRWFEVDPGAVDEFVDLSGQGWERFESLFDARIFGLFRAPDGAGPIARLLLITRYGDHGVWQASRDPSTEAMRIFARRQQLTRRTWAASTLLVSP